MSTTTTFIFKLPDGRLFSTQADNLENALVEAAEACGLRLVGHDQAPDYSVPAVFRRRPGFQSTHSL